jgi:glycosyltransferase involved in cell wall biosynthesis
MVVATVGRITQLKDLETFIGAVAKLKRTYPNIAGLIVGGVREDKEAYFASLKVLVKEKGVEQEIHFTGSQSHVAEIYALSDVVVSSSKKPESFGRSVAEAIAMNTPVVATGHGGVLDIVAEGENGFFYPPEDAASLAQGIVQAKALQFDGYGYVKRHFSLDQMVEKTLGVYHDLV